MAEDHRRAARLAEGLRDIDALSVSSQHTNMVFIEVPGDRLRALDTHLRGHGILASIGYLPAVRLVTHLDIGDEDIDRAIDALRQFFT